MKEEKLQNTRKPSYQRVYRELWNLRGQHNWEENTHTHVYTHTHNTWLTATPSGEVAQMLVSAISDWGLNREVWVAC